jgi:hypothetical protein
MSKWKLHWAADLLLDATRQQGFPAILQLTLHCERADGMETSLPFNFESRSSTQSKQRRKWPTRITWGIIQRRQAAISTNT